MRWLPKLTVGTIATFAAVFIGLLLYVVEPKALTVLRNIVFDQYQRWHPRTYQPVQVRIIDFDDESLKRIGQWPWPRTTIAELINRLRDAGVASIGFDVIFAEEDRTSPKSMVGIWNVKDELSERLLAIPDHDQVMAQALKKGAVVLGFAGTANAGNAKMPTMRSSVVNLGESALPYLHPFAGAVTSLELLERAATGVGSLSFVADLDGVVRRVPLMVRVRDKIMPSLVSESLRVGLGQRNYNVKTSVKKEVGVQEIRIGQLVIPTTREGELWVHYTRPAPQRTIPAWQIFEGKYPQGSLDGYVVLVGTSAQGLMDLRSSPMGTIMPGIEAHAQALEQILTDKYLERPTWATVFEAFILIVGGLIIGTVALTTRALVSAGFTAVVIACGLFAAWRAFTADGLLFDPVTPSLALLITFILGSVIKHMNSEREQRWVREAFSRYVSPNRVDYLVDNPGQLELGGRRQECSFVFTDLENFTGLMEKMDPGAAVALLNAYLDRMVAIAFASGGTLDRIVGDAVAIMFSAPVLQPDHRERAYKCALEMHAFASSYSAELEARGTPFGKTRIGVHTGEVIVGNFGGSTMFDYRALGDPVNTAARLEGVNKHLGTTVCVSEATLSGCSGAIVRPVGRLVLKGKTQELMVYEPIVAAGTGATGHDAEYGAAFELLRQGSPQALPAFEKLAHEREHDALVSLHLGRLRAGEQYERIVLDEK